MAERAKYNTLTQFYVPLYHTGGIELTGGLSLGAGVSQYAIDFGSISNTANTLAEFGTGVYRLRLTAGELAGGTTTVWIRDTGSPKRFLDHVMNVQTYGDPSAHMAFDLDTAIQDVNVAQISGDLNAAANLKASVMGIIQGSVNDGSATYTGCVTDIPATGADDHYMDRTILWTSGPLSGSVCFLTDWVDATQFMGYTPTPDSGAPNSGDTFLLT